MLVNAVAAKHLLELHDLGNCTQAELAELFGVGRSTIYLTIYRMRPNPSNPSGRSPRSPRQRSTNTETSTPPEISADRSRATILR